MTRKSDLSDRIRMQSALRSDRGLDRISTINTNALKRTTRQIGNLTVSYLPPVAADLSRRVVDATPAGDIFQPATRLSRRTYTYKEIQRASSAQPT
ncbi:MAG: hypothetical protein ACKO7G_08625, partial [Gammaproteobacteria bacterium]